MGPHGFSPSIAWDRNVNSYLQAAFGPKKFAAISEALCRPSLRTCLRVNTLSASPQAVVQQLQQLFPVATKPFVHPSVPSAVIVPGRGPLQPDYESCGGCEVLINRLAAESVLKGAHVFSPGLLAASRGLAPGDQVAVAAALEQQGGGWCGVNRGMTITPELKARLASRSQPLVYVGVGRVMAGRAGLFRQQQGLAVEMTQRVFDIPPCNGVLRGQVMLQALPCIVAAQALDPEPGSRVLDMCAAPGGKTSMLAQIMGDVGELVALDRTKAKQQQVQELAADFGIKSISALAVDATQLWQRHNQQQLPLQHPQQLPLQQQQQQQQQQWASTAKHKRKRDEPQQSPTAESSSSSINSSTSSSTSSTSSTGSSTTTTTTTTTCSSSSSTHTSNSRLEVPVGIDLGPESFDHVLLDAPCSALGLRPRLLVDWKLPALQQLAAYQRALLHSAIHVLRPGGSLVYCTCTINPGENEENVRYVLDRFPEMHLVEQPLVLGHPGLVGPSWLSAAEAQLVQRFDPVAEGEEDTIGFFIAKFQKIGSSRML